MKKSSHKKRVDIVYSTNPDFEYESEDRSEDENLPPGKQNLRVMLDKKQRKGKAVTLIAGFVGSDEGLKELGKELKSSCGTGGSVKDGEILIQGDFCNKVIEMLQKRGYQVKRSGG